MTKEFKEIFEFVSKQGFSFIYTKNGDESNFIKYEVTPTKKLIINISNQKDENLTDLLRETLKELKDRFE